MKKISIFILCLLIVLLLCGCSDSVTVSQSKLNILLYEKNISQILEEKNLTLTKAKSDNSYSYNSIYNNYDISISDNESIHIYFENYSGTTERFQIMYNIYQSSKDFDIELLVSLINTLSGKKVSKEIIQSFISEPEDSMTYGRDKEDDDVIFKYKPLNFWEEWTISYRLKEDNSQEFVFYGLTDSNK